MYILRNIKNANHIRFLSNLKKDGPISIEGNRCPGVNLIQVVCKRGRRAIINKVLGEINKGKS